MSRAGGPPGPPPHSVFPSWECSGVGSEFQCTVAKSRNLSVDLPDHRIAACLGKAALRRTHSRRFAQPGAAWQSRSAWSASDLSALSVQRGTAQRFMAPIHDFGFVEAFHEPARPSNCSLPWESGAEDARTPDASRSPEPLGSREAFGASDLSALFVPCGTASASVVSRNWLVFRCAQNGLGQGATKEHSRSAL